MTAVLLERMSAETTAAAMPTTPTTTMTMTVVGVTPVLSAVFRRSANSSAGSLVVVTTTRSDPCLLVAVPVRSTVFPSLAVILPRLATYGHKTRMMNTMTTTVMWKAEIVANQRPTGAANGVSCYVCC